MSTSTSTVISVGTTYRVYDESVEIHNGLPVGTYKVRFNEMSGFSLQKTEDLEAGGETVYGNHAERVALIQSAYQRTERSLGVLLSGDKGMGKSLMVRMLAEQARNELKLPVIIIDQKYPGLADFLDSWGEAMMIFDEFEKVFPNDYEEAANPQDAFLSLFDGTSTTKRLYAVTVNQLHHLSDYFVNRPGRFHYHLRFEYPASHEVRQYLVDQAPAATEDDIEKAVAFSLKVNLNFDHLRAIAFELQGGAEFSRIIGELNIKRTRGTKFSLETTFADGQTNRDIAEIDLFDLSGHDTRIHVHDPFGALWVLTIDPSRIIATDTGLILPPEAVKAKPHRSGDDASNPPVSYQVELTGSRDISFAV